MFEAASKMGLERIVSKHRDKAYTSGPCKQVRIRMRRGKRGLVMPMCPEVVKLTLDTGSRAGPSSTVPSSSSSSSLSGSPPT
jgi:hypothetical protein